MLSMFVPFYSTFFLIKLNKELEKVAQERGVTLSKAAIAGIVLSAMFPLLPLNIGALGILQHNLNKLIKAEKNEQVVPSVC